ncbi:hypothetical protein DIPPA_09224 [Diplonema papillatum]|nr:hypothetical protein DIPPA_09224 [Diplonema papillatum]
MYECWMWIFRHASPRGHPLRVCRWQTSQTCVGSAASSSRAFVSSSLGYGIQTWSTSPWSTCMRAQIFSSASTTSGNAVRSSRMRFRSAWMLLHRLWARHSRDWNFLHRNSRLVVPSCRCASSPAVCRISGHSPVCCRLYACLFTGSKTRIVSTAGSGASFDPFPSARSPDFFPLPPLPCGLASSTFATRGEILATEGRAGSE